MGKKERPEPQHPAVDAHLEDIRRAQEQLDFSHVSWSERGAVIAELEPKDPHFLGWLKAVLFADFKKVKVINGRFAQVWQGRLPVPAGLNQPTVLGVLEQLGLGPEELSRLPGEPEELTLAIAFRDLEVDYSNLCTADRRLVDEVKARLLELLPEDSKKSLVEGEKKGTKITLVGIVRMIDSLPETAAVSAQAESVVSSGSLIAEPV